jgi:hypothetical protein
MIEIRKVENDRAFMGMLLDHYLDKSLRYFNDLDDAFRIHDEVVDYLKCKDLPEHPFPGFEQLLKDEEFLHSDHADRILKRFVRNVDALQIDRLEYWKDEHFIDYNFRYINIWEDDRLPHYYILHDEPYQSYLLLDRESGRLLPYRFHLICPSDDRNIIIGEHLDDPFSNLGICAIRLRDADGSASDALDRPKADHIPFESVKPGQSPDDMLLIFPMGTNVPHQYIPLRSVEDIMFRHRMRELIHFKSFGEISHNQDPNEINKSNDQSSDADDMLPF